MNIFLSLIKFYVILKFDIQDQLDMVRPSHTLWFTSLLHIQIQLSSFAAGLGTLNFTILISVDHIYFTVWGIMLMFCLYNDIQQVFNTACISLHTMSSTVRLSIVLKFGQTNTRWALLCHVRDLITEVLVAICMSSVVKESVMVNSCT